MYTYKEAPHVVRFAPVVQAPLSSHTPRRCPTPELTRHGRCFASDEGSVRPAIASAVGWRRVAWRRVAHARSVPVRHARRRRVGGRVGGWRVAHARVAWLGFGLG